MATHMQAMLRKGCQNSSPLKLLRKFDLDKDGTMNFEALKRLIRRQIRIPPETWSDDDIVALASVLDHGEGTVVVEELAEFIERGPIVLGHDVEADENGPDGQEDENDEDEAGEPRRGTNGSASARGKGEYFAGGRHAGGGARGNSRDGISWHGQLIFPSVAADNVGLMQTPGMLPPKQRLRSPRTVEVSGARGVAGGRILTTAAILGQSNFKLMNSVDTLSSSLKLGRPGMSSRPGGSSRPGTTNRPATTNRPGTVSQRPATTSNSGRPGTRGAQVRRRIPYKPAAAQHGFDDAGMST